MPKLSDAISLGLMAEEPGGMNNTNPSSWDKQWIFVSGTFDFDNPGGYGIYTFNQSRIYMDAGAQMRILNSGRRVMFWGSEVQGCDEMWRRIGVMTGGEIEVYFTTVKHGVYAFELQVGSSSAFVHNKFHDNYIGFMFLKALPVLILKSQIFRF